MPENYHLPSTRPLSGLAFPVDEFLRDYQPSTELVRSIHSQEASSGVGTYQQLEDYYNKEINDGKPLSKEDWKNSEYYRDGLEYYDGMTDTSANILARRHDTDALSSFVRERSSYGQALYGFFFGGIPGSFQDPLNLGLMFVPPVGEAKVMKMLGISSGIKRMVAEGAYRGAITNAYFEPMSYIASSGLQQDYGVGNTISNIALGGFVGAGLHTSEKFIGSKLSEKIRTEYKIGILDNAVTQLERGVPINVDHVVKRAERMREINTLKNEIARDAISLQESKISSIGIKSPEKVSYELTQGIPSVDDYTLSVKKIDDALIAYEGKNLTSEEVQAVSNLKAEKEAIVQQMQSLIPEDIKRDLAIPASKAIEAGADKQDVQNWVYNDLREKGIKREEAIKIAKAIVPEKEPTIRAKADIVEKQAQLANMLRAEPDNIKTTISNIENANNIESNPLIDDAYVPREPDIMIKIEAESEQLRKDLETAKNLGYLEEIEYSDIKNQIADLEVDTNNVIKAIASASFCMRGK